MLFKKFEVKPNEKGFLFKNYLLSEEKETGVYKYFDVSDSLLMLKIPIQSRMTLVVNQEVLTKDNIALRFSYLIIYRIENALKFIRQNDVFAEYFNAFAVADFLVQNYSQVDIRKEIAEYNAEELNSKRGELLNVVAEELISELKTCGIIIEKLLLKDLTFPKGIQNLFAKRLEAQVRAKTDLENARTSVATARTLKNASKLMKDDGNIRFIQLMEAMTKISAKGNHTFVLSDFLKNL
jgi:regulator of protease activity HflC (stomatin/prohibitin superfamily)